MANLTFKTFEWPVNPEVYHEDYQRDPIYTKTDDGDTVFSGMGPMKRVITGSGSFYGANAATQFKNLSALFVEATSGALKHSVWGTRTVFFTQLQMTQPPKSDYVTYSFTFTEADSDGAIPK